MYVLSHNLYIYIYNDTCRRTVMGLSWNGAILPRAASWSMRHCGRIILSSFSDICDRSCLRNCFSFSFCAACAACSSYIYVYVNRLISYRLIHHSFRLYVPWVLRSLHCRFDSGPAHFPCLPFRVLWSATRATIYIYIQKMSQKLFLIIACTKEQRHVYVYRYRYVQVYICWKADSIINTWYNKYHFIFFSPHRERIWNRVIIGGVSLRGRRFIINKWFSKTATIFPWLLHNAIIVASVVSGLHALWFDFVMLPTEYTSCRLTTEVILSYIKVGCLCRRTLASQQRSFAAQRFVRGNRWVLFAFLARIGMCHARLSEW
jgi:hypothetical protein